RYDHLQHFIWGQEEANSHYRSLQRLLGNSGVNWNELDELPELPAPVSGVSLQELKVLANEYGVPIKVAYRELGAELITNSITLFKLGHYAYIGDRTRDQILPST